MRTILTIAVLFGFSAALSAVILDGNAWPLVKLTVSCAIFVLACGAVSRVVALIEGE